MTSPAATHAEYVVALMEYQDGLLPWPPCERCCLPVPDAPFTGATLCDDCDDDA